MSFRITHATRLLLVEDDVEDVQLVRVFLGSTAESDDNCWHVKTLKEASEALRARCFDVVLLDLRLPDGSGVECVDAIRRVASDVPIVVLTGMADEELAVACLGAGAQDYISKNEMRAEPLRRAIGYAIARAQERSQRKRADSLQQRMAAIVESSSDAIISSDVNGVVFSWNRGAELILGYAKEEAIGQHLTDLLRAPGDAASDAAPLLRANCHSDRQLAAEVVRLTKAGQPVTLSVVGCDLRGADGELVGLAAICRDVTESRRRDDELRRRNEELIARERQMRALTQRLHDVREDERKRISREIHDELGQLLTGLKMDLRWVERRLSGGAAEPEPCIDKLDQAQALVDRTVESVQRIAVELRPSALDSLGLSSALRDEARRFSERTGVSAEVQVGDDSQPSPAVATALFRIFQELLTNVTRHARASMVTVTLRQKTGEWVIELSDDGVGIPPGAADEPTSLGVLGMRERAAALSGTLALDRGSERGTIATVKIPA